MSDLMSGAELPTAEAGSLATSLAQSASDRESVVTCQLATQEDEFTKIQVGAVIIVISTDPQYSSRVIGCLSAPTMSMASPPTATSRTGSL